MRSLLSWWVVLVLLLPIVPSAHAAGLEEGPFAGDALAARADVPEDFAEETAFDDLVAPASIEFAPDGRVFVGQLDGVIKVYDSVADTTASVYADLSQNVAWFGDRGLLGLAIDPGFTTGRPYLYVSYSYDAAIGGTAPRWNDNCPDPPGMERDGCVVSGRLSKILPDGTEVPLITDEWCQQYSSHSLGDLKFGVDGALYVSAGDGASYTFADYGQDGAPVNPCGDPPVAAGTAMPARTGEGGALRAQDVRTSGDPTGLSGSILRIDPDTGEPLPSNPGTGDRNARRIIAYGLRNPFRFAFRPGTTDMYVGDVGWLAWEEIDRIPDTTSQVRNYGWPCYEGAGHQGAYEAIGTNLCTSLYAANNVVPPLYTYNHGAKVASESCPVGSASISGIAFYDGTTFPLAYRGAMFFADYSRNCIWVMFPNADGTPNPATRQVFVDGAETPVDLQVGPGGDLYYADVGGGTIQRIRAINPNQTPTAAFTATPPSGNAPLRVDFDASGSSDPNEDPLQYAWDLDGDGEYDDSTARAPSRTYTQEGNLTVRLRVADPSGATDTEQFELTVGTPPTVTIAGPADNATYAVGEPVPFAGSATRPGGSQVPADQLVWALDLNHCSAIVSTSCHIHHLQNFTGVRSGSFAYPDHEYPSHITLTLTAIEPSGLRGKASVRVDPKTVELSFDSAPSGLTVAVGGEASATPFKRTVARGSTVGIAAAPAQSLDGYSYDFGSWSDGGEATHQFTAPDAAGSYTVRYTETVCPVRSGIVGAWGFDEPSGTVAYDTSGRGNTGTISGATRSASGRFGAALSFDGVNDIVNVADANSLDLVSGMTLEGWVNPSQLGNSWRTVLMKEQAGALAYALYAHDGGAGPSGHAATPFEFRTNGPVLPLNAWSYLTTTYDGATLRIYVNGTEVSNVPATGPITVGSGALRIGGNTVWNEWFAGRLDDLRIYDRALSGAEVRVDMTRPVTCVSDPSAPVLSVSPSSLAFTAEHGGAAPGAKTIAVANSGGGTLAWSASSDASWLAVSPSAGTGAGTLTVTAATSALAAGTYTANVTISASGASGSPRVVPVTVTVTAPPPGPALGVSPAALSFNVTEGGSRPAAKTLEIVNTGGGTLTWTASAAAPWLSVSPASGTNAGPVSVEASAGILTPGTYSTTVTITAAGANGSPKSIPVTFTIDPPEAAPVLTASPSALAFTATAGSTVVETKAINVANGGGGTLTFTASANVPWLTVSPAADAAPRTVSVTPSTAGLSAGVYTGTVTIASAGTAGSPKSVAVTFTVNAAPACAAPAGLVGAWGFDEASGTVATDASTAANTGTISGATRTAFGRFGGALSFDGVNDWVTIPDANSLDLTSGMTVSAWVNPATANGAWRTVALKERTGAISYALYGKTETVHAGGSIATPLESSTKSTSAVPAGVWTHLATTFDGATLRMYVNGVQVSSRAVTGSIIVGTGALRIGGNSIWSEWFSGLIDEVRVYNRALGAADVQSDLASPVTCASPAVPALSVTPANLTFSATQGGSSPAAKTLAIANTGGGSMAWTASASASWLAVSPPSGTNGGTLTVTPTLGALAAGTYTTDVTITAGGATGSPKTIPVTFTVEPAPVPPELAVTPSSLVFRSVAGGAAPAAKTLAVANAGSGSLEWSASDDADWVELAPASGTNGGTITVTPRPADLAPGTYTAEIAVTGAGATGSPKRIAVTLTVDPPPPVLTVAPSTLSFSAQQGAANPAAQTVSVSNGGGGTMSYTVSDDAAWLTVTPVSGTAPATLSLAANITGLAAGSYPATVTVTAAGATGSPKTVAVTLTVTAAPAVPAGLVAAYGFEETTGTGAADASGAGNLGTISGATRSATGRFGRALSFDGVNDWVTVADANSLDVTTGVTMSAWVNPTVVGTVYRTVLMKEQPGGMIYTLYAGDGTGKPSGHVFTTGEFRAAGTANTAINAWTYLTTTWDGTTLRLFVNGAEAGSRALSGTARTSTGALRIGGNAIWSEWFRGLIDEVRVYNRALTLPEIQGDMNRPVPAAG